MSFIKYDSLSRPIEGGVASLYSNFTNFAYENNVPINTSIVWDRFVQIYDTAATGSPISSGHFRGRVTTHKVWQKWTGTEEADYIVYYDYDLMGRVKREIHEIPILKRFKHDKFEMSYLYDAISGKVRQMIYNKGKKDEFFHKFAYDAMGNLKYVWTSRDGKKWTLESALKYYPDGKLMRREIRPKDLMLQGLDYAYTLDGWLKAINSEVISDDPSKDGISGTYQYFARDVFSLLLRYYPNDYKPIKLTATPLEASITSGNQHLYKPYYTGWISSWSLNLDTLHTAYSFRYDRLGRLTRATTLTGFNGSEWDANLVKNYSTKYSYDLVGNILNLTRYGSDTNAIDVLTYEYYNRFRNNRLKRIVDAVNTPIPIDLETQPANNYSYDAVGNMIEDRSRNMQVFYTYSNKPRRIHMGNYTIKMLYNPSGYRFFKGSGTNKGDVFIYNSQGQLIAKYTIDGRKLKLDFVPIYEGTKRLGILEAEGIEWYAKRKCYARNPLTGEEIEVPCGGEFDVGDAPMMRVMPRGEGRVLKPSRKYELTDHLNNVRVVIRDQRVPVSMDGSTVAYYKPLIESIHDYYPFGWEKQLTQDPYPFTYQGQLFDADLGWQYYRYRNYDPMIARFHQVEPLIDKYPWLGYVFSENKVTYGVELEGLEIIKEEVAPGKFRVKVYMEVVNTSANLTNEEIENEILPVALDIMRNTMIGEAETEEGTVEIVDVEFHYRFIDDVSEGQFVVKLTDEVLIDESGKPNPNVVGHTMYRNSWSNLIKVRAIGSDNNKRDAAEIARTLVHELWHAVGGEHKDTSLSDANIMHSEKQLRQKFGGAKYNSVLLRQTATAEQRGKALSRMRKAVSVYPSMGQVFNNEATIRERGQFNQVNSKYNSNNSSNDN